MKQEYLLEILTLVVYVFKNPCICRCQILFVWDLLFRLPIV